MAEVELMLISAVYGFLLATTLLIAHHVGGALYDGLYRERPDLVIMLFFGTLIVVLTYLYERVAPKEIRRLLNGRRTRVDLVLYAASGAYLALCLAVNFDLESRIQGIYLNWALGIYLALTVALASATLRSTKLVGSIHTERLSFVPDDEISDVDHDCLQAASHARKFAGVVELESRRGSIVFGVDGPWGVGKSSFVNFAKKEWDRNGAVIALRFEPLRYLGEKDLITGLIQELSGRIGEDHFSPELRPLASKYSRMIKAAPGLSLPGVNLSFNGEYSTIDEIIFDVNEVLRQNNRRSIIIIDDLDRLEIDAVNRILFMVRRSGAASNISFVLVYDMEKIVSRARDDSYREYLEKFVNAKITLFADLKDLAEYLRGKWLRGIPSEQLSSSSKVLGLQSILNDLADLLEGEHGGRYVETVGNIRKIKRLINSMLLMGMEEVELGQTDFNRQDLLNLVILQSSFPGVFRDIYAQEGEGRTGIFSLQPRADGIHDNHQDFEAYTSALLTGPQYLVRRLFCAREVGVSGKKMLKKQLDSLACINSRDRRNLAKYLELIVRFVAPDPLYTTAAYEAIFDKMLNGGDFTSTLGGSVFDGNHSAQARLISMFAAAAGRFEVGHKRQVALHLMQTLPFLDCVERAGPSERSGALRSLAHIVNSMSPGLDPKVKEFDIRANELMSFVVGSGTGDSVIERLSMEERGVQGISDLLEFRAQCCADTVGPFRNIYVALFAKFRSLYVEWGGDLSSKDNQMVIDGVRYMSQFVFGLFKSRYIDGRTSVFIESWRERYSAEFDKAKTVPSRNVGYLLSQLSSVEAPIGNGVGCGYYDESGDDDCAGIGSVMNKYVFEVCFNCASYENVLAFADYCLSSFSKSYGGSKNFAPTSKSLERALDGEMFKIFWISNREIILSMSLEDVDRVVVSANYSASYANDLRDVWNVLDSAYLDR
ncbi:P-loop NTPase fold protein [Stenotrophomonas indicatrix]